MIEIEDKIVSTELLTEPFCCDPAHCKGMCCVEGDAGAPLEIEEAERLEQEFEAYKPFMKPEGIEAVCKQGFIVVDSDGDYTTPLIGRAECAFSFEENGITLCAIERAYQLGKTDFIKPISCHLYPIRLTRFSNGSIGLNYHRWSICSSACRNISKRTEPTIRMQRSKGFGTSEYRPDPDPDFGRQTIHHREYGSTCGSTANCGQNIYNSGINSIGLCTNNKRLYLTRFEKDRVFCISLLTFHMRQATEIDLI